MMTAPIFEIMMMMARERATTATLASRKRIYRELDIPASLANYHLQPEID